MSDEYAAALKISREEVRIFQFAAKQYRSMQIDDEQFLAARERYNKAKVAFDEAYSKEASKGHPDV